MNEKELIEIIVNLLNEIEDAKTVSIYDFTEDREQNMIIVSSENVEQLHFQLPDYSYTLAILVDSFIDEDKNGETFHRICKDVFERLNKYVMDKTLLNDLFGNLGIVYFAFEDKSFNLTDKSNQLSLKLKIIQSL